MTATTTQVKQKTGNHSKASAEGPLSAEELRKMHAYWRAANYLSVGQIYLMDNPLLKEPLQLKHVKPRLLGHWGTTSGQNFLYVHLNRVIKLYDLNMLYISGPGHGGPALVANAYLEGTYSEVYPNIGQDEAGLKRLFTQFSFPGGIPSHVAPETPGSIHEGGELGYALSHAYGAAFDNPDLIVACVVGDGEAETGPLATGWHGNKFLNPVRDGCVLPILHLNGYKIANPTVLARISHEELDALMRGYGYTPYFVEGDDPAKMHQLLAGTLDRVIGEIKAIQADARSNGFTNRPLWPMIVFRSPKGWTGPKEVDGQKTEGYWRSHQVPMADMAKPGHVKILETWMKSYKPEELFDKTGRLIPELAELAPKGEKRMSANPHTNGGLLLKDLKLPDFREYAVEVPSPGARDAEATRVMGKFLRDVMKMNLDSRNFRLVSPDESNSNRWQDVLEVTNRAWVAETLPYDDHLNPDGRVMEVLSEHQCQGWLEGYLLDRAARLLLVLRGLYPHHRFDVQPARQVVEGDAAYSLAAADRLAELPALLARLAPGPQRLFSHQDPGFIDHVVNKKAEVIRVYLPPDANTLLSVTDHCLRSRNYVNLVVAGKQLAPQWLTMDQAVKHCTAGIGIWDWASNDQGSEPDVVMACCGDVPTLETLAAVDLLRKHLPELKVRVINVVDLMKLQPASEHPHGLSDQDFDSLFTKDKPIIFAFHGYPWLIHRLTYRRTGPQEPARARLQGRRHDDDSVRHGGSERLGPLPPGHGRDRPAAAVGRSGGVLQAGAPREAYRTQALHLTSTATTCRKSPTGGGGSEEKAAGPRARDTAGDNV